MKLKKLIYSATARTKRIAIKKEVKEKYGQSVADRVSEHIGKALAELKKYPEMGISMREQYHLDCDYYVLFVEHNYFIYRILEDGIMVLEVFHEKEDFLYQMFGIVTTTQETIDYWGEEDGLHLK